MRSLTADEIRASFINCSQGAAKRLPLPANFDTQPWDHLDALGWTDPSGSGTAYLVVTPGDQTIGFLLRQSKGRGVRRQSMCSLCATVHSASDVALMVAPRPGAAGREGNTRGNYLCADLACSLYVRGLKKPARVQPHETLTVEQKVFRLQQNLDRMVERLAAA